MRAIRTLVVFSCVLSLAGIAPAQPAGGVSPVLKHVPADAIGFLVVNNVKAATDSADKYLAEIGLDKMIKEKLPQGILGTIKAQAKLGEGFNANGGFAAVMLDPKPFGMKLMEVFGGRAERGPDGTPAKKPEPPIVLLVPGKDVKSVFGQYELTQAGAHTKVKFKKEAYAAQVGEYVAISPSAKALDAVLNCKKPVASALSPTEARVIGASAAALRMNMQVLGPPLMEILKAQMGGEGDRMPPQAMMLKMALGGAGETMADLQGVTIAARFTKAGALLDLVTTVKPGSKLAQQMVAPPAGHSILGKVPNLKYVLAIGSAPSDVQVPPETQKAQIEAMKTVMQMVTQGEIPDPQIDKIVRTLIALGDQVRGMQLVAGGPAGKAGVFGLSIVLDCKSADKLKAALGQAATTLEGVIKQAVGEDAEGLKIEYQKGIETVGGTPVDAISVSHPELAEMEEADRAEMKSVLGEDKIRVLVADADATTVVLTFGGGKEMMAKALAAAKAGNGTILKDPGAAEAMKFMPKQTAALVLLNAGNLMELILAGMKKMDPEGEAALPFQVTCKTPLAIGVGVEKNAAHVAIYVPTKLVKEVAGLVMMQLSGPMDGPAEPAKVPGGDDF